MSLTKLLHNTKSLLVWADGWESIRGGSLSAVAKLPKKRSVDTFYSPQKKEKRYIIVYDRNLDRIDVSNIRRRNFIDIGPFLFI